MRGVGLLGWLVIATAFVVTATVGHRDSRVPSFTQVIGAVQRPFVGRLALVAAWLVLGWHLFVQPPST